jgi:hypothetical protein
MNNIASPFEGSLVYVVSEKCLFQYDGSNWSKYWKSDGNTANNSDFIGTTNNQDLKFNTNNSQRMVIKDDGTVGVRNLANPLSGSGRFSVTSNNQNINFFHTDFGNISFSGQFYFCGSTLAPLYNGDIFDNCNWFGGSIIIFDGNVDRVIRSYSISGDQYDNIFFRLEGRVNNASPWVLLHEYNGWWGQNFFLEFNVNAAGISYQDFRLSRPSGPGRRIGEIEFNQVQNPDLIVADNGFVGVNTLTPTQRLHVDGNILATGTITPDYVFSEILQWRKRNQSRIPI